MKKSLQAWIHFATLTVGLGLSAPAGGPAEARPSNRLPERFERYLSTVVRPAASERTRLLAGSPLTKRLDTDETREVAVFGAVWIEAPLQRYVDAVNDIERLEHGGGYRTTTRVSDPPRLEDFAAVTLPAEDVKDLRQCRVGDCELKLSQSVIGAIQSHVDFRRPAASQEIESIFREWLYQLVTAYRTRGNAGLAVYRDASRPTFVAAEFASMIDRAPALAEYLPDLRHDLLEYPAVTRTTAADFLYWQEVSFGLKPTIRISHLTVHASTSETVVASKMLYASHYFWTALEVRVLVPDPARGSGFWFVTVNRSRSDGLSGFTGFFVRRRVYSEIEKSMLAGLTATKLRLERPLNDSGDHFPQDLHESGK